MVARAAESADARNSYRGVKKGNMKTNAAPAAHTIARTPQLSKLYQSRARCERSLTGLIGRAAPAVADHGEGAGRAIRTFREETSR